MQKVCNLRWLGITLDIRSSNQLYQFLKFLSFEGKTRISIRDLKIRKFQNDHY